MDRQTALTMSCACFSCENSKLVVVVGEAGGAARVDI